MEMAEAGRGAFEQALAEGKSPEEAAKAAELAGRGKAEELGVGPRGDRGDLGPRGDIFGQMPGDRGDQGPRGDIFGQMPGDRGPEFTGPMGPMMGPEIEPMGPMGQMGQMGQMISTMGMGMMPSIFSIGEGQMGMGMGMEHMGMGMGPPPGMVVMDWSTPENDENFDEWVEDDWVPPTPPVYEDMEMVIATTGNDSLVGKQGSSTQFQMIQGTSLGGTDTISGGGGANMLTFQSIDNIDFVYDVTNGVINYANQANSITGNITVSGIQELYADDGISGSTLLDLSGAASGIGYILAGTNNGETISAAATTALNGSLGNIAADNVKGALIFGKGGNDTITAHPAGSMVLGGAGNDAILGSTSADLLQGGADNDSIRGGGGIDIVSGGTGDDTFIFDYNNLPLAANTYTMISDFTPGDDKFQFTVDYLGDGGDDGNPLNLTGTTLAASENNAATLNAANNAAKNLLIVTDAGGFASMAAVADAIDGATANGSALVAYFDSYYGRGQIYYDSDIGDTGGTETLVATLSAIPAADDFSYTDSRL